MSAERLQKIIARAGISSRRAAESLIEQGRVTVNGKVAKIGQSGDPQSDDIRVDGARVAMPSSYEYIILNKPRGVISDLDVSGDHANARDLIPLDGHLYPVGRLDLTSEGLMLFTNDGDLAHKLTHPRYEHPKTYQVVLAGSITEQAIARWRSGVVIEGKKTLSAEVTKMQKTRDGTVLEVTMKEGRKRQIRKIAAALGYEVISLTRTRLGPLALGELPEGGWRRLTPEEIQTLLVVRRSPEPKRGRSSRSGAGSSRRSGSGASKGTRRQRPGSGSSRREKPGGTSSRPRSEGAKRHESRGTGESTSGGKQRPSGSTDRKPRPLGQVSRSGRPQSSGNNPRNSGKNPRKTNQSETDHS